MTNEEAKQEAIKKAYGEHWDKVKDHVKESGGLSYQDCTLIFGDIDFYFGDNALSHIWENDYSGYYFPKEIFNINNNNGWIRIEQDGSNLPTDTDKRYRAGTLCENGDFIPNQFHYAAKDLKYTASTHYKPITPELKPIY